MSRDDGIMELYWTSQRIDNENRLIEGVNIHVRVPGSRASLDLDEVRKKHSRRKYVEGGPGVLREATALRTARRHVENAVLQNR